MVTQTVLCSHCGSPRLTRDGKAPNGKQKYLCHGCGKRSSPGSRHPCLPGRVPSTGTGRLPRALLPARRVPHLRHQPRDPGGVAKKKRRHCPPYERRWSRPCPVTCWNSMNSGRSCASARTSAGSGLPSAAGQGRSWPTPSAGADAAPAASSGGASRWPTREACCSRISGRPMPRFFRRASTGPPARAKGKRVTSSASTTSCASGWAGWCGRHSRSRRRTSGMTDACA